MAKLKEELNIVNIVSRMLAASGLTSNSQLAQLLGLSPQALNQLHKRDSISLHLLLLFKSKYDVSLDYLVYGTSGESHSEIPTDEVDGYIEIEPLNVGKSIFFPKQLLPVPQKKGHFLKAYVLGEKIWVINSGDRNVVDGTFAFGDHNRPVFCECRVQWDGNVLIGDDSTPKTLTEIEKVGILGRVVWQGFAT